MAKITEHEVMSVLEWHGNCMTYQLANIITAKRGYKDHVKTPQALRFMKKMEQEGKVKRVRSAYAVQLCWALNDEVK
jgi:repressor of nif and glnA expression